MIDSEIKHYESRDIMALDKSGNYYCRHVSALTRENLVGKSEIAAELGYRDMIIDQLEMKLKAANDQISMQSLKEAMQESIEKSNMNLVSGKW